MYFYVCLFPSVLIIDMRDDDVKFVVCISAVTHNCCITEPPPFGLIHASLSNNSHGFLQNNSFCCSSFLLRLTTLIRLIKS